jgi:subtilase family serine protease
VRKLFLAVCVVLGSAFLAVPPAHAAPPPLPPGKSKHVCDTPAAGAVRCYAHIRTDDNLNPLATSGSAGLDPAKLRDAYGITDDGAGKTIAIVVAYGYANAKTDLDTYRERFDLDPLPSCTSAAPERCFQQLNQAGQPSPLPADNISWSQEAALDLDMASAICESCKLLLVHANSNSWADVSTAVATAGRSGAHAISNSYGADESRLHAPYEQTYNIPGVAVTVATGDAGYGVSFPASSPHVVAVGGTRLDEEPSNSRGWTETVWSGTGSGCSTVFAKPSWQTDSGCGKRTVGDVAAVADPNTGVSVYWNGPGDGDDLDWYVFGGTSVGAPIIAAAYAINGGPVNYAADIYSQATALNDVTEGSNGRCKKGGYLCTAAVGYDGPTGHGSLNGTKAVGGGTTS